MREQLNSRNRETLEKIFQEPSRVDIEWDDFKRLMLALGAKFSCGRGAGRKFFLNGRQLIMHEPHPHKELKRYQVKDARDFLFEQGITP